MSTIRIRSPASYWLAVPAAAWMLGVVGVPIVLLVWVSFWGGRAFSTASPLTFDNYAVLRQPDLPQAGAEHDRP